MLLILLGSERRAALVVWRRDAAHTPSPNAGQSMAALAGQLGVRLEKRGTYVLNAAGRTPAPTDLACARRLVLAGMLAGAALSLLVRTVARDD
jgi:adenosylcobinamide-phosphate synthase